MNPNGMTMVRATTGILVVLLFSFKNQIKKLVKYHLQRMQLMSSLTSSTISKTNSLDDNNDNVNKITVSGIFIHPIKSLRPVSVQSTKFTNLGLEGDRTLMIVRPTSSSHASSSSSHATHRFITQRQCPALATINASLPTHVPNQNQNDKIVIQLSHDENKTKVFIDISPKALKSYPIRYKAGLWNDVVDVVDVGDEAAAFIQHIIKTGIHNDTNVNNDTNADAYYDSYDDIRVVSIIPNVTNRKTDERYVPLTAYHNWFLGSMPNVPQVALSDGFPILITSEESLEDLNNRLESKGNDNGNSKDNGDGAGNGKSENNHAKRLPMSRFRPNIVVKGLNKAFDEDEWKAIQIGGKNGPIFHIVKGCPRCKQSCTDQMTGERDIDSEPLKTLKDFRALGQNDDDVYFGQNVVLQPIMSRSGLLKTTCSSLPSICVGDEVRILTRGDPVWDIDTVEAE
jgi:uncharacterized protein YcbX